VDSWHSGAAAASLVKRMRANVRADAGVPDQRAAARTAAAASAAADPPCSAAGINISSSARGYRMANQFSPPLGPYSTK